MSFHKFWTWYEKYYRINLGLATFLFLWQLIHLYWLTIDVVLSRLVGHSFFHPSPFWRLALIAADYAEISAIITATVVYIHELRKKFNFSSLGYIFLINSQWLHLFWITDEFVIKTFTAQAIYLPIWLAWIAIGIDYLELPVIYDTLRKFIRRTAH